MKRLSCLIIACLIGMGIQLNAQPREIRKFINEVKTYDDYWAFTAPGWLIRMGANLGGKEVEDPDAKEALRLMKHVKKIRVLFNEEYNTIPSNVISEFLTKVKEKHGFEEYVTVRDKSQRVNFLVDENDGIIKNLLVVVHDSETFVLMTMKTKLLYEDLQKIDLAFLEAD